jgi:hypothetical protein
MDVILEASEVEVRVEAWGFGLAGLGLRVEG